MTKNRIRTRRRKSGEGVVSTVHAGLTTLVWSVCICAGVGGEGSPQSQLPLTSSMLPFTVVPTCFNSNNQLHNSTIPTTLNSTALLLFSSSSSSSCSCNVTSHSQLQVILLWPPHGTNTTTIIQNGSTTGRPCSPLLEGKEADGCSWNTSTDDPDLSIVVNGSVEEHEPLKESGAPTALLMIHGQGNVTIQCSGLTSHTTRPPPHPVITTIARAQASATAKSTSLSSNGSSTSTPVPPTTKQGHTPTRTFLPVSSSVLYGTSSGGGDGDYPSSSSNGLDHQGKSNAVSNSGGPGGHTGDKESIGFMTSYVVLGVGTFMILVAVLVILCVIVKQRNRAKKARADEETTAARQHQRPESSISKDRRNGTSRNSNNIAQVIDDNSCRDSLLNENHNYEEVSDDGMGGMRIGGATAGKGEVRAKDSKISSVNMPAVQNEGDYSRIQSAGGPPTVSAQRCNTTPTTPAPHDNGIDDYSHLNLSGPRHPQHHMAVPEARKLNVSEDGEYMDVNDTGNGDIYESVDGAETDRTPLCPHRVGGGSGGGARGEGEEAQDYMDCISTEDGKFCIQNSKVSKIRSNSGRNNASLPEKRPTLPISPPPSLPFNASHCSSSSSSQHPLTSPTPLATTTTIFPQPIRLGMGGLKRHTSRSVENLALRDKFRGIHSTRPLSHNKSLSLDLNHQHHNFQQQEETQESLCRQRDIFLQNFRSQAAGAESNTAHLIENGKYSNMALPAMPNRNPDYPGEQLKVSSSCTEMPPPQASASPHGSQQTHAAEPVKMRRMSRGSPKKKGIGLDGPLSIVQQFQELNSELMDLESAVRHSMEIKDDEFVMFDNILYDTLPRGMSQPTTEL